MTLQEMQARAREEFKEREQDGWTDFGKSELNDWQRGFNEALKVGCNIAIENIARVRTETLDAVEAGIPIAAEDAGKTYPTWRKYLNGKGGIDGWNECRKVLLAHLRALREGDK